MIAKLKLYGPHVVQLIAATLLVFTALTSELLLLRVLDLVLAFAIIALGAWWLGRRSAIAELEQSMSWLPKSVHVHEDDDGKKHALVEQQSGDVVSLAIPDEIDSGDEAMRWILDELSPDV